MGGRVFFYGHKHSLSIVAPPCRVPLPCKNRVKGEGFPSLPVYEGNKKKPGDGPGRNLVDFFLL